MGQQQLLLVILVTIIVGIATVVAINTFGSAAESANLDAVRQDIAQVATSAQAWYIRPTMLEGGGNSFTGLTFNRLSIPSDSISADGLTAFNANGTYVMSATTGANLQTFTVTATPSSQANVAASDQITIVGTITPNNLTLVTND
jgi:Tfp pilus assembly protein PilE